MNKPLEGAGTIYSCRFIIVLRNGLQTGQEQHHRNAQILIRIHESYQPRVNVLIPEQVRGLILEKQQNIINRSAVVLKEEIPNITHNQGTDDNRHINDCSRKSTRTDVHIQE